MAVRHIRAFTFGLLASTAIAAPGLAQTTAPPTDTTQSPAPGTNATDVTAPPATTQQAQVGTYDPTEIVVTAQKREENLQDVPISVQAIGTRRLDQLNISNFEDYTKQLPSVSFLTTQPGVTTVYMRGVSAAGGTNAEGNHSGPLPQVGSYLDEQPVTTIGGTLDVHIYDIARIESLSGPQGTLYGARHSGLCADCAAADDGSVARARNQCNRRHVAATAGPDRCRPDRDHHHCDQA